MRCLPDFMVTADTYGHAYVREQYYCYDMHSICTYLQYEVAGVLHKNKHRTSNTVYTYITIVSLISLQRFELKSFSELFSGTNNFLHISWWKDCERHFTIYCDCSSANTRWREWLIGLCDMKLEFYETQNVNFKFRMCIWILCVIRFIFRMNVWVEWGVLCEMIDW